MNPAAQTPAPSLLPLPAFVAPARFDDAAAAQAQVQAIYDASVAHLRDA